MEWHQRTTADTLQQLESGTSGLRSEQVRPLRDEHGANELVDVGGRSVWLILWEQLSGAMIVLLFVAAAVSLYLHETTDAIVILAIVALNAALGFSQDYRAEKALAALKRMAIPIARVRRDGVVQEISSRDLVPGDVVLLEVGSYVPADCRMLDSVNVKIQEAALTGESAAIEKSTEPLETANLPLGDRCNMAYMGTYVTYGHGSAVVTNVGMQTQLGQIARSLQTVRSEPTPLQTRLAQLGRMLAVIAIVIVLLVFGLGVVSGENPRLMLMTALSLAVAVVPEGLPAVATVALALGASRMFKRQALIRKLPAVETLGSVTVICSDKTGTLTENRMTVTVLDVASEHVDLSGAFDGEQSLLGNDVADNVQSLRDTVGRDSSLAVLLTGAAICNDAELVVDTDRGQYEGVGDPTEVAMVVVSAQLGLNKTELDSILPRCGEVAFDSDRKRMTTVHRIQDIRDDDSILGSLRTLTQQGQHLAVTKGAVDQIADVCRYVLIDGQQQELDQQQRDRIARSNEELAARGMRVLGVAVRAIDAHAPIDESIEQDLLYVGLLGMIDPPRAEVADAVQRCRSAGIRPVMITGDHPLTGLYVAKQVGIATNDNVLTGLDLEQASAEDLRRYVADTSVFARVAPHHKLRLVQALQDGGEVVAMTGDGVNDAPALKQAHIGVAMGITGTDVSKEASQMILLDDNFATIVGAVEEGRIAYDNIRKFVKYTMTSNTGEIWVMVMGTLLGMPLALLPLQILWVNLVTDGLPGLALAIEKAEKNTMRRPPFPPNEPVLGRGMGWEIGWIGLLMGIVSISLGYWHWVGDPEGEAYWRTMVFTTLTLAQLGNAMATRSEQDSLFRIGVFSNPALVASVALTFALQLAVIYWLPLQSIFKTAPLSLGDLMLCIGISTTVFWAVELRKLFRR